MSKHILKHITELGEDATRRLVIRDRITASANLVLGGESIWVRRGEDDRNEFLFIGNHECQWLNDFGACIELWSSTDRGTPEDEPDHLEWILGFDPPSLPDFNPIWFCPYCGEDLYKMIIQLDD